jgi:hypothetical protein
MNFGNAPAFPLMQDTSPLRLEGKICAAICMPAMDAARTPATSRFAPEIGTLFTPNSVGLPASNRDGGTGCGIRRE